jgi:hypothetical protein
VEHDSAPGAKRLIQRDFRGRCGENGRRGTVIATVVTASGGIHMLFSVTAILIGVVGILYVRRRGSRKKQHAA